MMSEGSQRNGLTMLNEYQHENEYHFMNEMKMNTSFQNLPCTKYRVLCVVLRYTYARNKVFIRVIVVFTAIIRKKGFV